MCQAQIADLSDKRVVVGEEQYIAGFDVSVCHLHNEA